MSTHKTLIGLFTAILFTSITHGLPSTPIVITDTIHYVGEQFGGGIIFYVDASKKHGLICSMSDIRDPLSSTPDRKSPNTKPVYLVVKQAVKDPARASEICESYTNSNYGTGQFSDWYLPSIEELRKLYASKTEVNQALENYNQKITESLDKVYWSSSKMDSEVMNTNWTFDFDGGSLKTTNLTITCVRAIRKF
jgi:hypothetical protein